MSPSRAEALPGWLVEHLPFHLLRQRWAGAHDRAVASVALDWHEVVRAEPPLLLWALAEITFTDDQAQTYQLFIGGRPADPQPDFLQGKERELLALVDDPEADGDLVLYDALVDPDLAIEILGLVAPDLEVEVRRPLVLEHSNSSIVFDESSILKVFRKVEPGPNPDVEITRQLAARGFPHVMASLAELRRDDTDLAVLREFLVEAAEGWTLARTSVRDVLASRIDPADAGGDFAPDAERLGGIIAELHLAMADAWGSSPGSVAEWVAEMQAHLDEVVERDDAKPVFDVEAVAERLAATARVEDGGVEMRIHGDLHLAQLLKADAGWLVLDFEGEPARRRADRFTVSSPLRDVAGMLRSLQYAAATGRADWAPDDEDLDDLAARWEEHNRAAFLVGYLAVDGIAALLPADPAHRDAVLAAFELDKAVYEVGYEQSHRPEQVGIPLAGISRVLTTAPTP